MGINKNKDNFINSVIPTMDPEMTTREQKYATEYIALLAVCVLLGEDPLRVFRWGGTLLGPRCAPVSIQCGLETYLI